MSGEANLGLSPSPRSPWVPEFLEIEARVAETADVFSIRLPVPSDVRRDAGRSFSPGQFNMLYLPGVGEAAISISSDPCDPRSWEHTIRAVGSVTRGLQALRPGAPIGVRGPYGAPWPVEQARGKDLLVIGGGIGLAPLRPILHEVVARRGEFRRVSVLYGARTPEDLLFQGQLDDWRSRANIDAHVTVDQAKAGWSGRVGVVTVLIPRLDFDPKNAVAMICGPEVMMRFVARELERRGLAKEDIWISMERNMKCAVGFCGHCQLGPHFVCKDGPVFRWDRMEGLLAVREL